MSGRIGPLEPGQTRDALVAEVAGVLDVLDDGARVIVACSGGPDSTVLAYLVADARPDLDIVLAHVRHGLRDDRADVEAVRQHAEWLGVPIEVRSVQVRGDGHGIEAAAREARYKALREIATSVDAVAILVGHTADDQAETVLLRLARGTGMDGIAAMAPVSGDLIRPLLSVRRVDVKRFLLLEGLPHVEDPTNADPELRRNVVRHELLSVLERLADDPVGALVRFADLARDERRLLDLLTSEPMAAVRRVGDVCAIPDTAVREMPTALARRVVRAVLAEIGDGPPDADAVTRALELADGGAVTLPGPVEAAVAAGWRTFAPQRRLRGAAVPLVVPGVAVWPPARVTVQAITADTDPWRTRTSTAPPGQVAFAFDGGWSPPPFDDDDSLVPPGGHAERMVLNLAADTGPFNVRHRQSGDRITTAAGTRSIQDVFVDAGVPRAVREIWPVVVDGADTVVWVPGVAADEAVLRAGRNDAAAQLRVARSSSPHRRDPEH